MLLRTGTRLSLAMVGVLLVALALLVGGCGGGGGGDTAPAVSAGGSGGGGGGSQEPVGNRNCLQCHNSFPSNMFTAGDPVETRAPYTDAGTGIGVAYQESVHNQPTFAPTATDYVKCEDCHGNGRQHFGTGPIPVWAPQTAQCGVCHKTPHFDLVSFEATSHFNANNSPDAAFGQGGTGTDPAVSSRGALYKADQTTLVSKNERIEECATCHAYAESMRPAHIAQGNLSKAEVGCSSCHDSHSPVLRNLAVLPDGTKASAEDQLRFKPQRVNNDPAAAQFGALNLVAGTWIRPALHFVYNTTGLTTDPAYALQETTQGDLLRLSSERACAACHTKGKFKYTRFRKNPTTGNMDVYENNHAHDTFTQWRNSGHADPNQLAFYEFSLMEPLAGSHRPIYPNDMGKTDPRFNGKGKNNYACNQCHHGIAAIDYINGTQGAKTHGDEATVGSAHILWGDSTITCITCHDPHKDAVPGNYNLRVPKYLSYNTWFTDARNPGAGNKRGGLNKMMDGTDIPANVGSSLICLDCHQGRESGYTLHRTMGGRSANYYTQTNGTIADANYSNAHYYSGGADLWSKNAFEFFFDNGAGMVAQQYSNGIPDHQAENCTGCHMPSANSTNTEGGHTWKPTIANCQTCHAGLANFGDVPAPVDVDGDPTTITVHDNFGVIDPASTPSATHKGLFNILRYQLYTQGAWYDPSAYPYFFPVNPDGTKGTGSVKNWTVNTYTAAFNLGKLYKAGSAAYIHNFHYDAQILIDSLRAAGRTTNPNTGNAFVRPTTPAATPRQPAGTMRAATDYRTIVIP